MAALPRELAQEAVDALATHGSEVKAARALGLGRQTYRDRLHAADRYGVKRPDVDAGLRGQIKALEATVAQLQKNELTAAAVKRQIVGLAHDIASTTPPRWTVNAASTARSNGVPTLFLSDWHWGEVVKPEQINGVNRFNIQIAHDRVKALVERAVRLLRIIDPKMAYPGIVVPLGGDMVSGDIHDELTATNELSIMPTVVDLFGVLTWVIEELLRVFPAVFLPCVTGNHGRNTQKIWHKNRHHTSFDWLLYTLLAKRFEQDKRVTFLVPDGPDAFFRVYGHRYLLTHGDQFRGGDGMIGALGPIIRGDHKKRSRNAQIDRSYDTMLLGHWHQYIHLHRLIVNGSLKGYDEYAYDNNFGFEPPQQALWLTHPKYGITYRAPVFCDRKREAPKTAWVSVAA